MTSEDALYRNLLGFLLRQLSTPAYTLVLNGTFTAVVILHVSGCLYGLWTPLMPALWTYLLREFAIHEQGIAIVAPRTTQIDLIHIVGSRDTTVVEDVSVGHILRCRGCSDVGIGFAENVTVLEPRC